jgi:hypothetical protein
MFLFFVTHDHTHNFFSWYFINPDSGTNLNPMIAGQNDFLITLRPHFLMPSELGLYSEKKQHSLEGAFR